MNRTYYDDAFKLFDDVFEGLFFATQQPSRYNKQISSASFPPNNITVDTETKELTIEVALAGCEEKDIDLSFDSDYLKLRINRDLPEQKKETCIIQKGLRIVDKAELFWTIDPRYYSRENVQTEFKNGLLVIKIYPREEVAPKKIKLFGSLPEKEQIEE